MNGLFLHTGNRLELLADELARVTAEPLSDPFAREVVLVQSQGMSRWLSLQLAARGTVCMATEFPFPRAFLEETLRRFVPEMAEEDAFATDAMAWQIFERLPRLIRRPEFGPVRAYAADGDALKRFQLAERLAAVFDQYLVYRPDLLLEWEAADESGDLFAPAGDAAWQAALWREINPKRRVHFGAALERLRRGRVEPGAAYPERVSIFGIATLPPAYTEVFFRLAARCPVHLFLLAPSREYHGDDLTPRQRVRLSLDETPGEGHPLLTSLGRLNAQFVNVLLDTDERAGHRTVNLPERFEEPPADSVLHVLQRDILDARGRGETGGEPPLDAAPDDRSVEIHVCHSPMREVEALYDRLLELLEEDPTLRPREILVMTPDIETYAPFIHAVFAEPENPAWRIPYSIADRQPRAESPAIRFFLTLLASVGGRFTAPEGFALLQSPVMRARYRFDDAELARLREWITESGIRWGIDAAHRASLGLPATPEATWRRGLERLLLGYAAAGGNRVLFENILPEDDVQSGEADLLGRFAAAMEDLFLTLDELNRARTVPDWRAVLQGIVERFFAGLPDEAQIEDVRTLREAVARLGETAAAVTEPVEFPVIREYFSTQMEQARQRGGFLAGGVTFCALKPMRSIPARVVWLMGMDEAAFPRRNTPFPFDLIGAHPRPGDRSPRDDDRYLFLEAILSARDRLRISYVGRSLVSRDEFPPSVVVSELLDALEAGFRFPGGRTARKALTFEHRRHGFEKAYFEPGGRLFSYSAANAAAAQAAEATPEPEAPFFPAPLPEPEADLRCVALEDLIAFFRNPAAYLLKRRLGITLGEAEPALEESEPLTADALGLYTIANELFQARFEGTASPAEAALAARALLPPGSVGAQIYRGGETAARLLEERVGPMVGAAKRDDPVSLDIRIGAFTLTGRLESLYGGAPAFFRPAKLKPKDRLRAWIFHLAWCAASPEPPPPALLAGLDETVHFAPVTSTEPLAALLDLYWRGLQAPLPFFPKTSLEFAKPPGPRATRTPLERARAAWIGNNYEPGEADDAAFRFCFGEADPLGSEFETAARAVYGPMLEAQS